MSREVDPPTAARPRRAALLALVCLVGLAALAVAGCGGGGSSSSGASTPTRPAAAAPKPSSPAATLAAERRAAGRAAPFVEARSDNSVPTFGSEAGGAERAQAEAALKAYLRARAARRWGRACAALAADTREGFRRLARPGVKGDPCPAVLAGLSKGTDLSDPLGGRLLSLRVQGEHGFALFYGPRRQKYIVPMNREGGRWLPTQSAPIPYPPGATG